MDEVPLFREEVPTVSSVQGVRVPSPSSVRRLLAALFRARRVAAVRLLEDGLCNFNYKVDFDAGESVVVRIYGRDPAVLQKEVDLLRLVGSTVPVPEILETHPSGSGDVGPFVVMRYVDGITFRQLRRRGAAGAIAQAAYSIGETLAAIARHEFTRRGTLGAGPAVVGPLTDRLATVPEVVDTLLASPTLQSRVEPQTRARLRRLAWSRAPELAELEGERSLVHRDFNNRNTLVWCERGRWQVAAVLDWEYAESGSPLVDVASFLRYERRLESSREPSFSSGFSSGGGRLPSDWWRLARVVDLPRLCEILTEPALPAALVREVGELVVATASECG
jgi:aminoglycoside phosphotransferase (APT) family kinase protein